MSPLPKSSYSLSWEDIGTDHPDVPAKILLSGHGTWTTQEPPRRTVRSFTSLTLSCAIRTLPQSGTCFNLFKTIFDFHYAGYGDGHLLILFRVSSPAHSCQV